MDDLEGFEGWGVIEEKCVGENEEEEGIKREWKKRMEKMVRKFEELKW